MQPEIEPQSPGPLANTTHSANEPIISYFWEIVQKKEPFFIVFMMLNLIYIYIHILLRTDFHWDCENRHVTRTIKKNIYKIARMSQGLIKKKKVNYGKGISPI